MSVNDSRFLGRRHRPIWTAGLDITIYDLQASGISRCSSELRIKTAALLTPGGSLTRGRTGGNWGHFPVCGSWRSPFCSSEKSSVRSVPSPQRTDRHPTCDRRVIGDTLARPSRRSGHQRLQRVPAPPRRNHGKRDSPAVSVSLQHEEIAEERSRFRGPKPSTHPKTAPFSQLRRFF